MTRQAQDMTQQSASRPGDRRGWHHRRAEGGAYEMIGLVFRRLWEATGLGLTGKNSSPALALASQRKRNQGQERSSQKSILAALRGGKI
jgi:hypothetical protein